MLLPLGFNYHSLRSCLWGSIITRFARDLLATIPGQENQLDTGLTAAQNSPIGEWT